MTIDLDKPSPEPVWPEECVRSVPSRGRARVLRGASGDLRRHLGADRGDVRGRGRTTAAEALVRPELWFLAEEGGRAAELRDLRGARWRGRARWVRILGVDDPAGPRSGSGSAPPLRSSVPHARAPPRRSRRRRGEPHGRQQALPVGRDARSARFEIYEKVARVSRSARAVPTAGRSRRWPSATPTSATAAAGRTRRGLVRVPAAWGSGGEGMVEGARVAMPYPEVAVIERDTLDEQNEAVAEALAARPIVSRRMLLHARRRCPRSRAQGRPSRHRVDRRPRRSEHARVLALREPLGHAVPDDPRRRRRGCRRRRARRSAQPRSAGIGVPGRRPGSTTRSTVRSRA